MTLIYLVQDGAPPWRHHATRRRERGGEVPDPPSSVRLGPRSSTYRFLLHLSVQIGTIWLHWAGRGARENIVLVLSHHAKSHRGFLKKDERLDVEEQWTVSPAESFVETHRVDALKSNQTIGMKSPLKLMPKSPRFFVSPAFKKQKTKPFILYWSMAD